MPAHRRRKIGAGSGSRSLGALFAFLAKTIAISLSGVLAPGPITAAAVAAGTRRRHAGAVVAAGHGVVELPLVLLILLGLGRHLQREPVRIGIGLAGGAFLLLLGTQLLAALRRGGGGAGGPADGRHPFRAGVVLTATNPYFLLWWATIGLALATEAVAFGPAAFVLFALVHWACDLAWLEALTLASFRGARILGERRQGLVLAACGAAMLLFGAMFMHDAGRRWYGARGAAPSAGSGTGAQDGAAATLRSASEQAALGVPERAAMLARPAYAPGGAP